MAMFGKPVHMHVLKNGHVISDCPDSQCRQPQPFTRRVPMKAERFNSRQMYVAFGRHGIGNNG